MTKPQIDRLKNNSTRTAATTINRRRCVGRGRGNSRGCTLQRTPDHDMLGAMKIIAVVFLSAAMTFAADITGKWTFDVVLDAGSGSPTFDFQQKGETLTGTYHGQFGEAKLAGTVRGDKVEFTFGEAPASAKYSGTLDGATKIKGTCDYGEGAGKGTFTGKKN